MKTKFRSTIRSTVSGYLRRLSQRKLAKCHKTIIGITGSLGKTTTRKAITHILSKHFKVDESSGNYNTDFGMMLSILKQKAGGKSPFKWAKTIFSGTTNALFQNKKYEAIALEMGVDKPGDMDEILKITQPEISIITAIAPTHLGKDHFQNIEEIFTEKTKLIRQMPSGYAILNHDDPHLKQIKPRETNAEIIWFGQIKKGKITELPKGIYCQKAKTSRKGLTMKIITNLPPYDQNPKSFTLTAPILGDHNIYSLLPAIATALLKGLSLKQCAQALEDFHLPPGRMNLIPGINKSTIIDSSYNASPLAMKAALKVLWDYPSQRKIAVLGTMNELGDQSKKEHKALGRIVPEFAQLLITVGEEAKLIAKEASTHGMPKHLIKSFHTAEEAGKYLQTILRQNDVILVKGSQNNIHLENCIKLIMQNPKKAATLLAR